jgi:hypothetical protein
MEAKIEATRREFQTQLKGIEAGTKHRRGTAKPPEFNGTTSWAVFQHQFKTKEEHNC